MCFDIVTEGVYVIVNEELKHLSYLDPRHLKCTDDPEYFWRSMEIINYFNGIPPTGWITVVTEGNGGDEFVKFNKDKFLQWLVIPARVVNDDIIMDYGFYYTLGWILKGGPL